MVKKKVVKRKWKLLSITIFLLVICFFAVLISFFLNEPIKNIYIKGNKILSDDDIIYLAKIESYPGFFQTFSSTVNKRLKNNSYVKDVKVKKSFYNVLTIEIEEYKALFIKENDNVLVLDSKEELTEFDIDINVPFVVNYIPDTIYDKFIDCMANVEDEVLNKISEIEYTPNDYDEGRFLLYMNDGNYVYVTLTKFNAVNYYNEAYPSFKGKKGIWYLDSGNYFDYEAKK